MSMSFELDLTQNTEPGAARLVRLQEALRRVSVLYEYEILVSFQELSPWHRSGSESYLASAAIEVVPPTGGIECRSFVAKAIVSWTPDISRRVEQLCNRYHTLESLGVHIPILYSADRGVIYQGLIPCALTYDAMVKSPPLLAEFSEIAATLDFLGAHPTNFVRDLMTDHQHVYYVDVGEDLGELGGEPCECAKDQMIAFVGPDVGNSCEEVYLRRKWHLTSALPHHQRRK